MVLTRFLRLQIWNASNTAVQYDNKEDTNWGITSGSVELEKILMSGELNFGEINASKLEIQVFGLNVNLANRKIRLIAKESIVEADYLEDSDSNIIVTDLGDKIELIPEVDEYELFSGYVNSSEKDTFATDRTIEGYDWFYYHRDDDIASFWNDFWETHAEDTVTVKMLRDALLTHMGLTYTQKTLLNDNLEITNSFVVTHTEGSSVISETVEATALKFGDIFSMLCKLQNTCPVISNDFTNIEFVTLSTTVDYNITDNLERGECKYEDYVTNKVTGIGIYDSSNALAQLVGTDTNVYKISGNIFLLNKTAQELTTIGTAILNDIKDIQYTPSSLKLIVSDITYKLGELVHTSKGNTYILSNNMSGSLVVDQILECKAEGALLSDKVENYNDTLIQGMKMSKIDKDIDHISLEVGEAIGTANEAKGEVRILAGEAVVKVTNSGRLASVTLDTDPETATANVTIFADEIDFIANDKIQLTTKQLGIESTNFTVTTDGTIMCKAGTIGDWHINSAGLYKTTGTVGHNSNYAKTTLTPEHLLFEYNDTVTYGEHQLEVKSSGLFHNTWNGSTWITDFKVDFHDAGLYTFDMRKSDGLGGNGYWGDTSDINLNDALTTIGSRVPVIVKEYTDTQSNIQADSEVTAIISNVAVSGYTPVLVTTESTGSKFHFVYSVYLFAQSGSVKKNAIEYNFKRFNTSSTSGSVTAKFLVLFTRDQ